CKALFYTYSIGDEVEEVLNANGILELINQDGNVITSSSLERIKRENQPETVMAERETNNKKNSTLFKKHSFQIQIFLLFFRSEERRVGKECIYRWARAQ